MSNKVLGVPEPHSDVVNAQPKVLLIGYGWVGQHVHKYFTQADYLQEEDGEIVLRNKNHEIIAVEKDTHWDLAFISVPTPMRDDGSCDVSIVDKCVKDWREYVDLFVIRSTVEPGTTDRLRETYATRVVMQPEYIGETLGHPLLEPDRGTFIILGGHPDDTSLAAEYWALVMHANCRIRQMPAKAAEWNKYMENGFLALKALYVNDMRRAMEADGVDFFTVREGWLDDPRIGRSHTLAYRHNPGFAGKCLPKDLNAIAYHARHVTGKPLELVESALMINAKMRKGVHTEVPLLPTDGSADQW